jgi:PAT family beta-lactamase induction signal transducer AmpG
VQILSNFVYIPVYYAGADELILTFAITIENFCSGLSNVVLVAYISRICNLQFTATHYALLSSLAAFARTTVSTSSGYLVAQAGWPIFFAVSAFLSFPAFFFIKKAVKFNKQ